MNIVPHEAERTPEQLAWDGIVQAIKSLTEGYAPKGKLTTTWVLQDDAGSVFLQEFDGIVERIILNDSVILYENGLTPESHQGVSREENLKIFFSEETRSPSEFRYSTKLGTVCFDNGIRRGKDRKSMHFNLHTKQDFAIDGSPKIYSEADIDRGHVELYIEGKIFQSENLDDAINSFSFYEIINGRLVPVSGAIADLTRSRVRMVQEIISSEGSNTPVLPVSDTQEMVISDDKPQYVIRVFEETLEVFFGGKRIGDVQIIPRLDPLQRIGGFVRIYQESLNDITRIIQETVDETMADAEVLAAAKNKGVQDMRTYLLGYIYGKVYEKNPSFIERYTTIKGNELINAMLPKEIV